MGKEGNTKEELMGLWGVLHFSAKNGIDSLKIFGDFKGIIDWELGRNSFKSFSFFIGATIFKF